MYYFSNYFVAYISK